MQNKPWHTLILSVFPILSLFAVNQEYVLPDQIWMPAAISIVMTIFFFLAFNLLFRNWLKSGIMTSILTVMFFNYGRYQDALTGISIPFYPKNIHFDHNFYKWSCLLLILIISWRLIKWKTNPVKLTKLLNFSALALLIMVTFNISSYQYRRISKTETVEKEEISDEIEKLDPNRPTIYYLIMDAYTRSDIIKEYFNYDNSGFTDFLKSEGFYVADQSISNYAHTVLSIPSSMNMMYMDSIIEKIGKKNSDRWPMSKVLQQSRVVKTLKRHKYKIEAYDAAMLDVVYLKVDKFNVTPGTALSLFHNTLINSTAIRAFNRRRSINTMSPEEYHRKKINTAFDLIEKVPARTEPCYIHGHVLAPHQPFLFNKDGSPRPMNESYNIWSPLDSNSDNSAYKEGYVEQLQYVNSRLKLLIHKIIHESKRPAIIIIQGDHGSESELRNYKGFENNDFRERFSIMNAYYFPDQDYSMLYPGISPVNSFKVVMNKYFKGNYKLEPDEAYFSDWEMPYDLVNVTDSVR